MQHANQASVDALRLRPGSHVLDVGCGAGDDARRLRRWWGRVGPRRGHRHRSADDRRGRTPRGAHDRRGSAFACSTSTRWTTTTDASTRAGPSGRFCTWRNRRRALAQMVRVVRPGGRIVVLDRDIETRTIDAADRALTRRIVNFWCDSFLGGWIGRSLPRLFREAGLDEISVEPFTVVDLDYDAFNAQYDLPRIAARADAAGVIQADEAERWIAGLRERERGRFVLLVDDQLRRRRTQGVGRTGVARLRARSPGYTGVSAAAGTSPVNHAPTPDHTPRHCGHRGRSPWSSGPVPTPPRHRHSSD